MKISRFKTFEQLTERVEQTHPGAVVQDPYSIQSVFTMIDRQVDTKFFNDNIEPNIDELKNFVIGLINNCSLSNRYKAGLTQMFQNAPDVETVVNYIIRYESGSRG